MAEKNAAGAVRRTPRPARQVPEVWWSPLGGGLMVKVQSGQMRFLDLTGHNSIELPEDAVQLAPVPAVARGEQVGAIKGGSVFDWVKQMVAEYTDEVGSPPPPEIVAHITVAVLREMGWERRPVVLLRAEDCACTYGDDCPHGPEPVDALDFMRWLHAESEHHRAWTLRAAELEAASHERAEAALRAERDALLPRLADLTEAAGKQRSTEWLRTCATLPPDQWPPAPGYKGPMVPAAELEAAREQVKRQHGINDSWAAYGRRVKAEREKHVEQFEDALGLPHAGRGYWYERMIEAAAKVRAERDALQARIAKAEQSLLLGGQSDCYRAKWALEALQDGLPRCAHGRTTACSDCALATLQGDQPTEPEVALRSRIVASPCTGNCDCTCRPEERWAEAAQPTGEADRG